MHSFVGLLVAGKHHFDAIDTCRHDDRIKTSLGIKQMPSSSTLCQRFNEDATKLIPVIEEALAYLLINFNKPLTPIGVKLDSIQHTTRY